MNRWRTAPEIAEGVRLFETGATRAAHEAWEDAWRAHAAAPIGEVARALSQWAAACVHLENGRSSGFQSVAAKAAERLAATGVVEDFGTHGLSMRIARFAASTPPPDALAVRSLGD